MNLDTVNDSLMDIDILAENISFFKILSNYPPDYVNDFISKSMNYEKAHTLSKRYMKYKEFIDNFFNRVNTHLYNSEQIKVNWPDYMFNRFKDTNLLMLFLQKRDVNKDILEIENFSMFKQSYINGRAPLLITPHLGSYMAIPFIIASEQRKINILMDGNAINDWMKIIDNLTYKKYILPMGIQNKSSIKKAIRDIKHGSTLLMLPEFTLGEVPQLTVDFLGNRVYAPTGPAKIAMSLKIPIVPVLLKRQANGFNFTLKFTHPLYHPLSDPDTNFTDITQKIFRWMEDAIEEDPSNWWGWSVYEKYMMKNKFLISAERK